ncbi:MAG: AsmA family protein [Curvibacter sp.]
MKQAFKYLLLALGGLLALVLAIVAYIAATFDPNEHKPRLIQLVKDQTARTLTIPGDIRLTFFPRVGAELGRVSLSEPRSEQVFAAAEQLRVSVALLPLLARNIRVERVLVDGLELKVRRERDGRYNFDDLLARSPATDKPPASADNSPPAALPQIDMAGITMSNARVSYSDAASGQSLAVSQLSLNTGAIRDGQKAALSLSADIAGQQPALALKLALRVNYTPALAQRALKLDQLDLSLGGKAAGLQDLQFTLGLASVQASADKIEGQGLALDLSAPGPAGEKLNLKAQGQASVDLVREAAQLTLDGTLDSTTLALKAGVQNFARPATSFDLALGVLDLDRYLPKPTTSAAASAGPVPARAEPNISLAALRGMDLRGTLKVATLKVMNLKTTGLRLQLKAQNGLAELNPVTASLYGGGFNGRLLADANAGQRLGARLDLRGIQIGPLMKDLLDRRPLEGRGNVALDLTTGGSTVSQLKKRLNGTVGVQLGDGAINGVDIAGAMRNAKAKLGGGGQEGTAGAQQKTDFSEFSASLKITDGVARNDDLSAKTPLLRLGGAGTVYLAEGRLDYTVKATVVPTLQGQGGPELEQLRGLTIPVRLSGPYSDVKWKIDVAAIAGQRKQEAQQMLDAKKEALKDKLKESSGDKLRNLLKR